MIDLAAIASGAGLALIWFGIGYAIGRATTPEDDE
jgi:hypothetical protein